MFFISIFRDFLLLTETERTIFIYDVIVISYIYPLVFLFVSYRPFTDICNFLLTCRKAMKRAHLQGASFGLSEAFMFFANAVAFRYGGYLVVKREMDMDEVMK